MNNVSQTIPKSGRTSRWYSWQKSSRRTCELFLQLCLIGMIRFSVLSGGTLSVTLSTEDVHGLHRRGHWKLKGCPPVAEMSPSLRGKSSSPRELDYVLPVGKVITAGITKLWRMRVADALIYELS